MIFHIRTLIIFISCYILCDAVHSGQEITGCGGFIKSHAEIDFSRVEIKLLTNEGNMKDKTDCSPSNGYYFLPIYDKGNYVLKISPPTGWSFDPEEIRINFDGKTDDCTLGKDLNFNFKGFGITGTVTIKKTGAKAKGVKVNLLSDIKKIIRTTTSDVNGIFYFTPVIPGKYMIELSHDKWQFSKSLHNIVVQTGNTELPSDYFTVTGFQVEGKILNQNQPLQNVGVALYGKLSDSNQPNTLTKFNKPSTKTLLDNDLLFYTEVHSNGLFKFDNLAPGKYYVKPYGIDENVRLNISPDFIEFNVVNDAVTIDQDFEVTGLNVNGKILSHENGIGIPNAKIMIKNKIVTVTDSNGFYTLENIKSGTYTIQVSADKLLFQDQSFIVSVTNLQLPNILVSSFEVCGKVLSEHPYTIGITKVDSSFYTETITNSATNNWCTYLPIGQYTAKVLLNSNDNSIGVHFFPSQHNFEVESSPISDLVFSQLKAQVSGTVVCFKESKSNCEEIVINMYTLSSKANQRNKVATTKAPNGKYTFSEVLPGTYEVKIDGPLLCWETTTLTVNVQSANEVIPPFVQNGYLLSIESSHTSQVNIQLQNDEINSFKQETTIFPGMNTFCVPHYGQYEVEYEGCHIFGSKDVPTILHTEQKTIARVKAIKHKNTVTVLSLTNSSHQLWVESENEKKVVYMKSQAKKNGNNFVHRFDFYLYPNEHLSLAPKSNDMLFKPAFAEIIASNDCNENAITFSSHKGIVIKGQVKPAISNVDITCQFINADMPSLKTSSNDNGEFQFEPIDSGLSYKISASKESYVFSDFDISTGVISAHKLCEIIASVKDEQNQYLSGVLLSLSGGESYRKNLMTSDDGTIKFHSLSPSQYFLRPMMKEYRFNPNSKIINVKDGESVYVEMIGTRVAYSLFGSVNSLNGEPFPGVTVEAIAEELCAPHEEEAITSAHGSYRIRGLQAGCKYSVRLKPGVHNSPANKAIPTTQTIEMQQKDITDINIVGINPINFVDVTVYVYASHIDYYKTLKVQLYKKDFAGDPIFSHRIETTSLGKTAVNPGYLIFFPKIQLDGKLYYVELTSTSLTDKVFDNVMPIKSFIANRSSVYVEMEFDPKAKYVEGDIHNNSLYTLILIVAIALITFQQDFVFELAISLFNKIMLLLQSAKNSNNKRSSPNESAIDEIEIEKLAQSINSTKKKVPKK